MLTEVQATSARGSLLSMVLAEISDGITLQDVEGLDPVKATIVSGDIPGYTGEKYQASKRGARDLTFTLGLNPDWVTERPQDVRNRLYQFFMPRTWVDLKFVDETGNASDIRGMVETFECPLFVQEPKATINVRCFASDFVDQDLVALTGNSVSNTLTREIEYTGTVETGIDFQLLVNRDLDEFTLYGFLPEGTMRQLDFSYTLHNGDVVQIITTPGAKEIALTRSGVRTSIPYAMSPQSEWIDLYPGTNQFRVYAEGAAVPYLLYYNNRYGGL